MRLDRLFYGILLAALSLALTGAAYAEIKDTVKIATKEGVGRYLTTADGRALYYFKKDAPGKSECSGKCAEKWPVYCFITSEISLDKGLKKSDFTSFHRPDDQDHLAYKGRPLYRYAEDTDPGDAKGHGVNGLWFLATP